MASHQPHNRIDADDLKARADMLAIVGRTVDLKQRGRGDWWGKCPFHGEQTASFHLQPVKGLWKCFGCGKGGDLIDFVRLLHGTDFAGALAALAEEVRLPVTGRPAPPRPAIAPGVGDQAPDWRAQLDGLLPFIGSPAAAYLASRGITDRVAIAAGLRYHPRWGGRPAAVFPLRDAGDVLIAAEGRYLDDFLPKVRAYGQKRAGVFSTPGAWRGDLVVFVEGAVNALSLAACELPAVATCGAENLPGWLPAACAGKRAVIAFDPDPAGAGGVRRLSGLLLTAGVPCYELPILQPGEDWNDLLQRAGAPALTAALRRALAGVLPALPSLASHAGRRVYVLDQINPGAIVACHSPDAAFPCGWIEVQLDDGQRAQSDARSVFDASTGEAINLREMPPGLAPASI